MSNLPIKDASNVTRKIDVFLRTEGADSVETQAVAVVDPATGYPLRPNVAGELPVIGPLTDAQLRAAPVPVSLAAMPTTPVTGPLTDAQLRAASVAVAGTFWQATQPVSGTFWQATQPVSIAAWAGLTDAQLRATALPVSGTFWQANQPVSGTFWQATQPVSLAAVPLPAGAATEATLAALAGVVKAEDTASADGDAGVVMLVQRRDTDATSASADGDYVTLKGDEEGRLKVSSKPASYADLTGDITAVQPTINAPVAGGTVAGDVSRASNVMAFCLGSFSTVNVTFEGSLEPTGETNWFGIQAVRSNANTIETATGNLSAAPAYAWEMSVNALARVRVRCTARTSGTQSWRFRLGTYATEPIPAAQVSATQPVSGSVTATLAAATVRAGFVGAAGIWYDDSVAALGASATFTGTSRDATVAATAAAFANAGTYAGEVRVCAESDVTGTLWLEASRDNAAWRRIKSLPTAAVTGGGFAAELVHRPSWRYWRVGYTNGAGAQARFTLGSLATAI